MDARAHARGLYAHDRVRLPDGRPAVRKRLRDPAHAEAGAAERLRWEGECLTALAGVPGVVGCYAVDRAAPALLLEDAPGGSLAAALAAVPGEWPPGVGRLLPGRTVAALGAALGAALDAAHAAGLVHRDVKPSNVLLRAGALARPGAACLADFGVAARVGSAGSLGAGWVEDTVGTLGYAAPEQLADPARAIEPAADVYALGVVLYELATGRLPHELARGENEDALRARIVAGAVPTPAGVYRPELGAAAERVLAGALARDPRRRPAGAGALARAWAGASSAGAWPRATEG